MAGVVQLPDELSLAVDLAGDHSAGVLLVSPLVWRPNIDTDITATGRQLKSFR